MRETGWLIERSSSISGSRPAWWTGRSLTEFSWNANDAVRFARREDAEKVRVGILGVFTNGWRVAITEHAFLDDHPETD